MRVALVSAYDLAVPGGVQAQVLGLARALGAAGHEVVVIAPGVAGADQPAGLELVAVGRSHLLPANGSRARSRRRRGRCDGRGGRSGRRLPTSSTSTSPSSPGRPSPRRAPATPRSSAPSTAPGRARATSPTGTRLPAWCAGSTTAVAVSEMAAETLRAAVGPCGVAILGNAVDLDRFGATVPAPTTAPTALFVGRIEHRKGLAVLLEAFGGLPGDLRLRIVGDGPGAAALRRRFAGDGRLEWLGRGR